MNRITPKQIRDKAIVLAVSLKAKAPAEIELILERDYGVSIVPTDGLEPLCKVSAVLAADMKTIYVDQGQYMDPDGRYDQRIRFSLAHELGHIILHRAYYSSLGISSVGEGYEIREAMSSKEYLLLERQADEFAGAFLVPRGNMLSVTKQLIETYQPLLEAEGVSFESFISHAAVKKLAQVFNVSEEVIEIRFRKEAIYSSLAISPTESLTKASLEQIRQYRINLPWAYKLNLGP